MSILSKLFISKVNMCISIPQYSKKSFIVISIDISLASNSGFKHFSIVVLSNNPFFV